MLLNWPKKTEIEHMYSRTQLPPKFHLMFCAVNYGQLVLIYFDTRPILFSSCALNNLAFERMRGLSWSCCDTDLGALM